MSNIVTGRTMPKDLRAVLQKYGMPEHCTKLVVSCMGPDEPLQLCFTSIMTLPVGTTTFGNVQRAEETRVFKLLAVE